MTYEKAADGSVLVWNVLSGEHLESLHLTSASREISGICLADRKIFVTDEGGHIGVFGDDHDLNVDMCPLQLHENPNISLPGEHAGEIVASAICGIYLATAGADGLILIQNIRWVPVPEVESHIA